jgi:hypothetical protein
MNGTTTESQSNIAMFANLCLKLAFLLAVPAAFAQNPPVDLRGI